MARTDELRLITKVARMYHERSITQSDIAAQLEVSQATVSRLLKKARQEKIIRTVVSVPPGAYPDLEEALQKTYSLKDVIVVIVRPTPTPLSGTWRGSRLLHGNDSEAE